MLDILDLLKTTLKIPKKSKLILSISGGADSMLLLALLKNGPHPIEVVHFNHMKRSESKKEAEFVKSYCDTHKIPYHYYLVKVSNGNFHHQAHILRNHYLKQTAKVAKAKYIFTAHHLDDLLESVLIKLTRGSNLLGYAGMQMMHERKGIYYVKPLLYTSKQDILDEVVKRKIPFYEDASNQEDTYLRNRYRHTIIPIMKQENDNLLAQIKTYHQQLSSAFQYIRNQSQAWLDGSKQINIPRFLTLDSALQEDIIAFLIENEQLNLSYETVMTVKKMFLSDKPNQRIDLGKKKFFVKAYETAQIQILTTPKSHQFEVKDGVNKLTKNEIFTLLNNSDKANEELEKLCYNKLAFPLWLRHRLDGDKLNFSYGRKKLKDFLIDKKIPLNERDHLWILTDNNDQILWVQDLYLNQTLGNENTFYFSFKKTT